MKVVVLNNMAPFVWGGAEELASHLERNLILAGHEAETVRIPFGWDPYERLLDEIFLARSLRIPSADKIIALKFPTYLVPAERKTIWLLHQYRQAYDLWDAGQSNIPDTPDGHRVREAIIANDNDAFAHAGAIFSVSRPPRDRLLRYNGVASEVLFAPLNDPELFTGGPDDGYVAAMGRINASKRQYLLIEALRHMDPKIRLVVAGPPDSPADAERLRRMVEEYGLEDWVDLEMRFFTRPELAAIVNGARLVASLPFEEDSMSYVAMEASQAAKPTITLSDAGGVLQLVEQDQTGYVCEPTPEAIARCLAAVRDDPRRAAALGQAARARWTGFGINWPQTVARLLAAEGQGT
jgi:glycosyltransferase involved in cell wall biosynthesis